MKELNGCWKKFQLHIESSQVKKDPRNAPIVVIIGKSL